MPRAALKMLRRIGPALALAAGSASPAAAAVAAHHEITATLEPAAHLVSVLDQITLPPEATGPDAAVRFVLNGAMNVLEAAPVPVTPEDAPAGDEGTRTYRVVLPEGTHTLVLSYQGVLDDPPGPDGAGTGPIDPAGVLLGGAEHWYPQLAGPDAAGLVTLRLSARVPKGWDLVGQGEREVKREAEDHTEVTWREDSPQDEIYLVAAPFTSYVEPAGPTIAMIYLRRPDEELARRYVTATARYVDLFSRLIGPYPYKKFALVENRFETGLGMPSFTLLGPTVIRLPFIPDTSYPHEILHNWWGNGVFMQPGGGNWAEGLTVYLADHLLAERGGGGASYRRETLQRYADYVREGGDFPLTNFVARTGPVTQAVGYGKAMMLFHMLRRHLGDAAFLGALRDFYRTHRFRRAGWDDLTAAFSKAAGEDLKPFVDAWLTRTGAPELALEDARAAAESGGYRLTGTLRQTQDGPPFPLYVPLAVSLDGRAEAVLRTVPMTAAEAAVDLALPARPLAVSIDPDYDLFRRLVPGEVPPALSGLLGAERPLFVLPAAAPDELSRAYGHLAEAWGAKGDDLVTDSDLAGLPQGRAAWVLGWENRFLHAALGAVPGDEAPIVTDAGFLLAGGTYRTAEDSMVLAGAASGAPLGVIATTRPRALSGLARKLPHYGKYGYLAFQGDAPDNVLKGQWPPRWPGIPAQLALPGGATEPAPPTLPPRPSLAP